MTIETWAIVLLFLLTYFIALYLLFTSNKAEDRCDEARQEADRLKEENEELRNRIRKMEIINLVNSNLYPKEK